jgi:hypothetical protein
MNTKELRAMLEKATKGPWRLCDGQYVSVNGEARYTGKTAEVGAASDPDTILGCAEGYDADMDLVVALRNAAPLLLDEIDALRARVAALQLTVDQAADAHRKMCERVAELERRNAELVDAIYDHLLYVGNSALTPAELAAAEARRQQPPPLPSGKKE